MDEDVRRITELEVRREALGKSRRKLAIDLQTNYPKARGLKPRTVERWEDLEHEPCDAFEVVLCGCFEVESVAMLGLGPTLRAARWRTWMTPEEMTMEMLHRRRMLHRIGAAGAAFLLLPVSELIAGAQLLDARRRIGGGELAFARRTATDLAIAYAAKPDTEAIAAAKAHAYTLLDRLEHATMRPDIETQLRAVASDAAALAGYGEMNAGRLDQAQRWFDKALELARQAGDRRLEAYALTALASIPATSSEADHAAAVTDLEAAAEFHPFLPPAGSAWVFAFLAEQHAELGHDLASGRFLELARAAAARVHYEEPGWGWWSTQAQLSGWDGVRPQVFTGGRALSLRRPDEALELFDSALDGMRMPARRVSLHVHLTDSCVALGDPERACASAHAGLDEAKAYGLGNFPHKIRKARRGFPGEWSGLAAVRELDERLALVR
ncbi:MAG: hypothetical protein ACRD0K_21210 [Egibacteraceae bacterium]